MSGFSPAPSPAASSAYTSPTSSYIALPNLTKPATGKGSRGPYKRRLKEGGDVKRNITTVRQGSITSLTGDHPSTGVRATSVASSRGTSVKPGASLIPGEDGEDADGDEGTWEDDLQIDVGGGGETAVVRRRLNRVKEEQMFLTQYMDADQRERFDAWKMASFPKAQMKKLIQQSTGNTMNDDTILIVGGVSKVFVGLIIAKARQVQEQWGQTGPLSPAHLREAHRLFVNESKFGGKRPGAGKKTSLFVR
ncbi:Transcription initiation factor TFIID, subunit TAF11 [Phaffia rhodozyma]|uniref:Transcription initiation factor TFIID, subunit TAF11 n=1 Tax=Phaffia rhodozyma TaxID=264483 RepID=A0A0F7SFH7_PHARH|nr:Transcription initiation factor TFIID, subunit TAF11 [Phaffia rhodozyma]